MSYTNRYRTQHEEIGALVRQVRAMSHGLQTDQDCDAVRGDLNKLAGRLSIHLSMEDAHLYPRLREQANHELRETAERFSREMLGLATAFKAYNEKWGGRAIKANKTAFAVDTAQVMDALLARIRAEDTTLYALADRHAA